MTLNLNKYYTKLANILIIIFPLLFAANVYISFIKEESMFRELETKILVPMNNANEVKDTKCSTSMFINASFAVVLAFMWNAKKAIKIGTI